MFVKIHWNDELKKLSPIWNQVQFYVDQCQIKILVQSISFKVFKHF